MKTFHKFRYFFISSLFLLPMISCSDDETSDADFPDYKSLITGEWFVDLGVQTDIFKNIGLSTWNSDGTTTGLMANVSDENSLYYPSGGQYTISGNKLTEILEGHSYVSIIRSIGKYDLVLFEQAANQTNIYHRIVETKEMTVGETQDLTVNDPDFIANEYRSSEVGVVSVSPTGHAEAKRAGTSYVSVSSPEGTAIIRIVVINPKSLIDDFAAYMGMKIDYATEAYGSPYQEEVNDTMVARGHLLLEDDISEVIFAADVNKLIYQIHVEIRNQPAFDRIVEHLKTAYDYIGENDTWIYLRSSNLSRYVSIKINIPYKLLVYQFDDADDPFAEYDNLCLMTATEAAEKLGHKITNINKSLGYFRKSVSNKLYKNVTVFFDADTDIISTVLLNFREGTDPESVKQWYGQRYFSTELDGISLPNYLQLKPEIWIYVTDESVKYEPKNRN